jgi:hypothetical protein
MQTIAKSAMTTIFLLGSDADDLGALTTCATDAPSLVPQLLQKFSPSGLSALHLVHLTNLTILY